MPEQYHKNEIIRNWISPSDLGRAYRVGDIVMFDTFEYPMDARIHRISENKSTCQLHLHTQDLILLFQC